jgi:hypothetical protein
MEPLSPAYQSDLAQHLGALSAFLGGFAATFLGTLLAMRAEGRLAGLAIGFLVVSAVAFIASVVGAMALYATIHPDAPAMVAGGPAGGARSAMSLGFMLGILTLLGGLAVSGWLRSRPIGLLTSVVSAAGLLVILFLTVRTG